MKLNNSSTGVKLLRPYRSRLLAVCTACSIIAGFAQQGVAQDASLTGVWTHSPDAKEQADRYEAIDQVANRMNLLMRGRARETLREKTAPQPTIQITDEGDRVTFSGKKHRATFKTDGTPTRVDSERGTATARAKRQNGKLKLTSQGNDGGIQTTVYSLAKDGTRLVLDVSIDAKMFKSPMRYKVTYKRASNQVGK